MLGGPRPRWAEQLLPGLRPAGGRAGRAADDHRDQPGLAADRDPDPRGAGRRAQGLPGADPGARAARAALFHKRILDTTRLGFSISDEVRSAIDDPEIALVTCVLNTIDDALDRSDPAGTTWTADAVKHLEPLLERARVGRRRVVITADHGHVVERRHGTQRLHGAPGPARHRPTGDPVEDGEVVVAGRRVLAHGGRAVLAVIGAAAVRAAQGGLPRGRRAGRGRRAAGAAGPGRAGRGGGARLAPPQQPAWWLLVALDAGSRASHRRAGHRSASDPRRPCSTSRGAGTDRRPPWAGAIVASAAYAEQRRSPGGSRSPTTRSPGWSTGWSPRRSAG